MGSIRKSNGYPWPRRWRVTLFAHWADAALVGTFTFGPLFGACLALAAAGPSSIGFGLVGGLILGLYVAPPAVVIGGVAGVWATAASNDVGEPQFDRRVRRIVQLVLGCLALAASPLLIPYVLDDIAGTYSAWLVWAATAGFVSTVAIAVGVCSRHPLQAARDLASGDPDRFRRWPGLGQVVLTWTLVFIAATAVLWMLGEEWPAVVVSLGAGVTLWAYGWRRSTRR